MNIKNKVFCSVRHADTQESSEEGLCCPAEAVGRRCTTKVDGDGDGVEDSHRRSRKRRASEKGID